MNFKYPVKRRRKIYLYRWLPLVISTAPSLFMTMILLREFSLFDKFSPNSKEIHSHEFFHLNQAQRAQLSRVIVQGKSLRTCDQKIVASTHLDFVRVSPGRYPDH